MPMRVKSFKIDDELLMRLRRAAEEDGYTSMSKYLRDIISKHLEERERGRGGHDIQDS